MGDAGSAVQCDVMQCEMPSSEDGWYRVARSVFFGQHDSYRTESLV